MKRKLYRRGLALVLAGCTLLSACGGGAKAATMHLRKTEGKVGVSDGGGKDVEPKENLGLYSGYEVDTRSKSYAWVDLDSVKLTKLDENSEIEIQKDGKKLEIEVKSGSLFFNVTEPLADDETMEIRASTMLVGIRGTCGWAALSEDGKSLSVYLLEGKVRCEADGEQETIRAGEMAVMTEDGEITVKEFTAANIPAFVSDELDGELLDQVEDLLPQGLSPEALAALEGVAYYGDPAACTMTPEQAAAFAQTIRDNMAETEAWFADANMDPDWYYGMFGTYPDRYNCDAAAALFDLGDGTPALLLSSGLNIGVENGSYEWYGRGKSGIWLYQDGTVVPYAAGQNKQALYDGYLLTGGRYEGNFEYFYQAFPIGGGAISAQPGAEAVVDYASLAPVTYSYLIDGQPASLEEMKDWMGRWVGAEYDTAGNDWNGNTSLAGFTNTTDIFWYSWGMSPAADVLAALELLAREQ